MAMRWRCPPLRARAAFADHSVVALRKFVDEIMRQSGLRGGLNALFRHVAEAVADIVPHRIVEEDIFLRDHGDLFAQRADGDIANVDAVDDGLRRR